MNDDEIRRLARMTPQYQEVEKEAKERRNLEVFNNELRKKGVREYSMTEYRAHLEEVRRSEKAKEEQYRNNEPSYEEKMRDVEEMNLQLHGHR